MEAGVTRSLRPDGRIFSQAKLYDNSMLSFCQIKIESKWLVFFDIQILDFFIVPKEVMMLLGIIILIIIVGVPAAILLWLGSTSNIDPRKKSTWLK